MTNFAHRWIDQTTDRMEIAGERFERCSECGSILWCGMLRPGDPDSCPGDISFGCGVPGEVYYAQKALEPRGLRLPDGIASRIGW